MANYILKQIRYNSIKNCMQNISKYQTIRSQSSSKLVFAEYGEPCKVIRIENEEIGELKPKELLIKMLAAPVNPADINTIQGTYAVKPTLPAVGGNEGVGEVIDVGSEVSKFKKGDRVVPLLSALGTWQTHAVFPEEKTYRVPKELGIVEAATFTVNPATAYRMLKDFVTLNPNDVVIQNGGNSACGQYVIQLCKVWGIRTVNIVRDRPNIKELKDYLTKLGATYVLTEEELRKTDMFRTKVVAKPKLALNCVGGKSATDVMRQLEHGGVMVTYGGMSREPVTIPISALIFKDIKIVGYWMTRWSNIHKSDSEKIKMLDELVQLMESGKIQGPVSEMVKFDDFKIALQNTLSAKGMVGKKYILKFA